MEIREYERLAALEAHHWYFRALHRRAIAELARQKIRPGASVLDAGCGTGGLLLDLGLWRSDLKLAGLDRSPVACEHARSKGFDVREGAVEGLPFYDGQFAAITCLDVLQHSMTPVPALLELFRCLEPGGALVLNAAACPWLWSYHDERVHTVQRFRGRRLRALLCEAGFVVGFSTHWNSLLFPVLVVQRKCFPKKPETGSDVQPIATPLNALLGAVAWSERVATRVRLPLPIGSSVFFVARKLATAVRA